MKYKVSDSDLNLAIIKSKPDSNSSFNAYIYRPEFKDGESSIVDIAESLYLPREIVSDSQENSFQTEDSVINYNIKDLWWRDNFDGIRKPYSLTKSAINYYIGLIESFRKNEFEEIGVYPQKSASFHYVVEIERRLTFERDGYVFKDNNRLNIVILTMKWESYCGDVCALKFEKKRIVVINDSGQVLAVFGDGPTKAKIS